MESTLRRNRYIGSVVQKYVLILSSSFKTEIIFYLLHKKTLWAIIGICWSIELHFCTSAIRVKYEDDSRPLSPTYGPDSIRGVYREKIILHLKMLMCNCKTSTVSLNQN